MNPRPPRPEEYEFCPLRCEWLFIAVSAPRGILFGGLVSVVSVCSEAVYGQICGQKRYTSEREKIEYYISNAIITYSNEKIKSKFESHKTKNTINNPSTKVFQKSIFY